MTNWCTCTNDIKHGEIIFGHCDNPNRTLQHTELSVAEGQSVAALTVSTLQSFRYI